MSTWVEDIKGTAQYYRERALVYESMLPVAEALDAANISALNGNHWANHIVIKRATEDLVPKLVAIKTAPVIKYFDEHSGELGYSTEIGEVRITVVPDTTKYVCKIKKQVTTTNKVVEDTETRYSLEGDCDPLFFEETQKEEEVVE